MSTRWYSLYINDITFSIKSDFITFTNDTNHLGGGNNTEETEDKILLINNDITCKWFIANKLSVNKGKNQLLYFSLREVKDYLLNYIINLLNCYVFS